MKRRSTYIVRHSGLKRIAAMMGVTAVLALGLTTVSAAHDADPASAHTWNNTASCEALSTSNTSYTAGQHGKTNTIKVTIDGKVVENTTFGTSFVKSYSFADKYVAHSWIVQVSAWDSAGYSYTQSGKSTPCVAPVTKDASASASVGTAATCLADSTVNFAINNATWNTEADLSVGTHTRTATAIAKHTFPNGSTTQTVTYTINAKLPAQSTNPAGSCYTPPPSVKDASASVSAGTQETCTADSTVTFNVANATWNTEADLSVGTHTRTATATDGHLFADGSKTATVTYTVTAQTPSQSTNPDKPCYTAPPVVKDASASVSADKQATCTADSTTKFSIEHASWDSEADLTVGDHTRTATADEGHVFSDGSTTATVTYTIDAKLPSQSTDKDGQCYVPPTHVPSNGKFKVDERCGAYTTTFTNIIVVGEGQVGDDAHFTYTDANGATQNVTVPAGQTIVKVVSFPEDSGDKTATVTSEDGTKQSVTIQTDCQANVTIPDNPTLHDSCGVTDDSWTVPGTMVKSDNPNYQFEYTTKTGSYYVNDVTVKGVRSVEIVFVPNSSYVIGEPGGDSTYITDNGNAVWTYTFDNEACQTTPPTTKPTPPVTKPTPTVTPTPTHTPVPVAVSHHNPPSNGTLAFTGSSVPVGGSAVAALMLMALGAGLITVRARRKKSALANNSSDQQ